MCVCGVCACDARMYVVYVVCVVCVYVCMWYVYSVCMCTHVCVTHMNGVCVGTPVCPVCYVQRGRRSPSGPADQGFGEDRRFLLRLQPWSLVRGSLASLLIAVPVPSRTAVLSEGPCTRY